MLRSALVYINGLVQGVGFRPFIYRVALKYRLKGYVLNLGDAGVEVFVEGSEEGIRGFLRDIEVFKPPLARVEGVKVLWNRPLGFLRILEFWVAWIGSFSLVLLFLPMLLYVMNVFLTYLIRVVGIGILLHVVLFVALAFP